MNKNIVYTFRDATGTILYVGYSSRGKARLREHRTQSRWYGDVASVEVEEFEDSGLAQIRELALIREHNPPHNKFRGAQPTNKTTIDLPHDFYVRLRHFVHAHGETTRDVVIRAVGRYMDEIESASQEPPEGEM